MLMLGASVIPANAAAPAPAQTALQREPVCESHKALCVDTFDTLGESYVGHDEPSVLFRSGVSGSGNDFTYDVTLPKDPSRSRRTTAPAGPGTSSFGRPSGSG